MVGGVALVELTGVWPTAGCCLSGLFCVLETWEGWLEGTLLCPGVTDETTSWLLQVLVGIPLSLLRCRLSERVSFSVNVEGAKDAGSEIFVAFTAASSSDGWDRRGWGADGQSSVSVNPCVLRGETGVGGPEGSLWERMVACWADSARASASMRAAFFGGGGGGSRDTELTGTVPIGESRTTAPTDEQNRGNWKQGEGRMIFTSRNEREMLNVLDLQTVDRILYI